MPARRGGAKTQLFKSGYPNNYTFDFANAAYTGPRGAIANPFASEVSLTRASTGMARNKAGVYSSFASGVPRITDMGLLIEQSSQNLVPNNSFTGGSTGTSVTPAGWGTQTLNGLTLDTVVIDTRNGIPYVQARIHGTTTSSGNVILGMVPRNQGGLTVGNKAGASFFFRHVSGTINTAWGVSVGGAAANGDLPNGGSRLALSPTVLSNNVWKRYAQTFTVQTSAANAMGCLVAFLGSGVVIDWTFEIGGLQIETAPCPTSPILTTGATVTRAADVVTISNPALIYMQGGAGEIIVNHENTSSAQIATKTVLSVNGGASIAQRSDYGVNTDFGGSQSNGSGRQSNWLGPQRSRLTWNDSNVAMSSTVNMASVAAANVGPAVTSIRLASDGTNHLNGYVSKLYMRNAYRTDLSDNANIGVDVGIYGATAGGIAAAINARRQGKSVAIFGGWREFHLGGMMSGGLMATDIVGTSTARSVYGGLGMSILDRITVLGGNTTNQIWNIISKNAETLFETLTLEENIPVYYTTGVNTVTKNGLALTSLTTVDSKTLAAQVFVDAGYEGDLLSRAATVTWGREAYDVTLDPNGGGLGGAGPSLGGVNLTVDPYVTPGSSGSGLIPYVNSTASTLHASDGKLQAYNFRMAMSNVSTNRTLLPSSTPTGYSAANYELLLRTLAAATAAGKTYPTNYSFSNGLLSAVTTIATGLMDVNGGDFNGQNWTNDTVNYATSTYAQRETIWQAHANYIRGWWYTLQYSADARIPAQLQTDALTYGLCTDHFTSPGPNDTANWPYYMYVREAYRLVGDYIHHENDLIATDGTTPRSVKTIAAGEYNRDSHSPQWYNASGAVKFENGISGGTGGANKSFPIPLEVILPKTADCSNLLATFCVSSTHSAFAALRVEPAHLCVGAAVGVVASVAIDNAVAVQSVDYPTVSTLLSATGQIMPTVN